MATRHAKPGEIVNLSTWAGCLEVVALGETQDVKEDKLLYLPPG